MVAILKKLVPVIADLVKALKDGKVTEEEKEALILEASLVIAEIIGAVTKDKK